MSNDWPATLRFGWRCACAAAAVAFALTSTPNDAGGHAAVPLTPEQHFALALEAQTDKDYPAMLRWLRGSGGGGVRPPPASAGMARRGGAARGGPTRERRAGEALDWFIRAADQGSEIGRAHRNLLNRQPLGRGCAI